MPRSISAIDVAEAFLSLADVEDDSMTHLKLQKLLYYAQGFHVAITGSPLFHESIRAWDHGPVVRDVWERYKSHGSDPISHNREHRSRIPRESQKIIEDVFRCYGQFSAWRLRQMTHAEPPWMETPRDCIISNELLCTHFSGLISKE